MTTRLREDILLDDVLQDREVTHFQEQVLNTCLLDLTRRRRRAVLVPALGVAALLLVALALYPTATPKPPALVSQPSFRVTPRVLQAGQRLQTSPAPLAGRVVRSQALPEGPPKL